MQSYQEHGVFLGDSEIIMSCPLFFPLKIPAHPGPGRNPRRPDPGPGQNRAILPRPKTQSRSVTDIHLYLVYIHYDIS